MSVRDKLKWYFELLGLRYDHSDGGFVVYYNVQGEDIRIDIVIDDEWVECKWVGPDIESLKSRSPDLYVVFLESLLKLNSLVKEAKIGIDRDNRVVAMIHAKVEALSYDVFESEFLAIPIAVQAIMENLRAIEDFKEGTP